MFFCDLPPAYPVQELLKGRSFLMNEQEKTIVASMKPRELRPWTPAKKKSSVKKHVPFSLAAAAICLCAGTFMLTERNAVQVMNHVSSGFEYDETLGRLQYVSNILPESAMVFLNQADAQSSFLNPTEGQVLHAWSQEEPWLEYVSVSTVSSCHDGEIMTVVKNRDNKYTVRILHNGGYESIYSGLVSVDLQESDHILAGEQVGQANGYASFELRKDGISILPVFGIL